MSLAHPPGPPVRLGDWARLPKGGKILGMWHQCRGPIWAIDDVDPCYREYYFEMLPIIAAFSVAVVYTVYQLIYHQVSHIENLYGDAVEDIPESSTPEAYVVVRGRTRQDNLRLAIELVLVASKFWVILNVPNYYASKLLWSRIFLNLWLFLLVSVRIAYRYSRTPLTARPFVQCAYLYTGCLLVDAVGCYSQIVHPDPLSMVRSLTVISFLQWIVLFTSPLGDHAARFYMTEGRHPNAEPTCSLLQWILCLWNAEMLVEGTKKPLQMHDVWELREQDHTYAIMNEFEKTPKKHAFVWRLIYALYRPFILNLLFGIPGMMLVLSPTIFVNLILNYLEDKSNTPRAVAWLYVVGIGVAHTLKITLNNQGLNEGRRFSVGLRAIIIDEIYHKALFRQVSAPSPEADEQENAGAADFDPGSTGAVLNLMSVDVYKISDFCSYLHHNIGSPLTLVFAVLLLYRVLSWSAFAGVAVMLLSMPLNSSLARKVADNQTQLMVVTDKRTGATNELIGAIRIIKFFAWEQWFYDEISKVRSKEMNLLYWRYMYLSLTTFVFFVIPILIIVASFSSYVLLEGKELTSSVAFTSMTVFQLVRMPLLETANILTQASVCLVSVRRILRFLKEPESPKRSQLVTDIFGKCGFEGATLSWSTSSSSEQDDTFKLRDIDVLFPMGELSVVMGQTGAGKTSFLLALLGEMPLESGKVFLPVSLDRDDARINPLTGLKNTVAYCPQQPWLVNDTVRSNIIFASPFDIHRYRAVLNACQLTKDLDILSDGDQTFIGDKGIALSGGQKQRVSLARALYSSSEFLLLDDCLSAVDSHTAEALYENALRGELSYGRTIVLVSHNVALTIREASQLLLMENGRVVAHGHPADMADRGWLGDDELVRKSATASRAASRMGTPVMSVTDLKSKGPNTNVTSTMTATSEAQVEALDVNLKLAEEEHASGSVELKTYTSYLKVLGGSMWRFMALIVILMAPLSVYLTTWWVKLWSSNAESDLGMYAAVYVLIGVTSAGFIGARNAIYYTGSVHASSKIFSSLLKSILRTKMRFFDITPAGRIINRFTKDIETIDQQLMITCLFFLVSIIDVITVTAIITSVTPIFLPVGLAVALLFLGVGFLYLMTSRELKRMEATSRSPIFQNFEETLSGAVSIRAYGDTRRFQTTNMDAIDDSHRPYFYLWQSNRWLGFTCGTVSMVVSVVASAAVIAFSSKIDAGSAGISLSFAMTFGDAVFWAVRLYSESEIAMNSMERVNEYVELEQEAPAIIESSRPPAGWPDKGKIEFRDLSLRYSPDLPLVIKNVSFTVGSGLKVGIVGRTGAGKSTIITALFRTLESTSGSIIIDGVDISKIGLYDLRRAISIIPQDPTLFQGTLRSNLDLYGEFDDNAIYRALAHVQLVPEATTLENSSRQTGFDTSDENVNRFLNLDLQIQEGGSNLSQGQRQLLCLARSILKEPRILLLDEATASIDYKTDALVQQTIRTAFSDVTILTIAHRLRTIADYDRVLVLEKGRVAQFGTPADLLKIRDGIFYGMCERSGELEALINIANAAKAKSGS